MKDDHFLKNWQMQLWVLSYTFKILTLSILSWIKLVKLKLRVSRGHWITTFITEIQCMVALGHKKYYSDNLNKLTIMRIRAHMHVDYSLY